MNLMNSFLQNLDVNVHGAILKTMISPYKLSMRIGLICGNSAMTMLCLKKQMRAFAPIVESGSGLSLNVNVMDILRLKNLNV